MKIYSRREAIYRERQKLQRTKRRREKKRKGFDFTDFRKKMDEIYKEKNKILEALN